MKVLKFGGTSVANAENIKKVIQIVKNNDQQLIVVVSALGGTTDLLIETGKLAQSKNSSYQHSFKQIEDRHLELVRSLIPVKNQSQVLSGLKKQLNQLESLFEGIYLLGEFSNRTYDAVVGFGELLSSYIINQFFVYEGLEAVLKNARSLIVTNGKPNLKAVNFELSNPLIQNYFENNKNKITVVPGFVAQNESGTPTTLGRGGSDYTAAILAGALSVSALEIWTDVSGMFTANPKTVKGAYPIKETSYQEAMELSHFGAKVLYPPTIQPALKKRIPIFIKNTFAPEDLGTKISEQPQPTTSVVTGISHVDHLALITLEGNGMIGIPGFSKKLFEALSNHQINVNLITQASSEHSICVGIDEKDTELAEEVVNDFFAYEISRGIVKPLQIEKGLAVVALIGDQMKNHQGISGSMFNALGKNNVNIRAITQGASENNISTVIAEKDVKKALNVLHAAFFENQIKELHLFVVGVGNVGGKLIQQIEQQAAYLEENLQLRIKICGLSNSRKMTFNPEGINLSDWKNQLDQGETTHMDAFIERVKNFNLRNSIFVDNTANESVASLYETFLKESIGVVTCNKIACASAYERYQNLKVLSRKYKAPFLYETNVGAGLPIINTLNNLIDSGDRVKSIQAVLSGSLNYIFNNFNLETPFYDVVKAAGDEGYTEPDPRIDISGVDVARKILILARESGHQIELEDIENNSFLPESSLNADSVPNFMETLKTDAAHFNEIRKKADENNAELKYVASFKDGKASVGLQEVANDHPFANLKGSDNIVLFYTDRYPDQPLIVKGAGAGADVTASGLFADIIRIGNM